MNKWDKRFLDLAGMVSTWSKDPSSRVGAVIVDNNKQVVSLGYNGFPRNIKDDDRLNNRDIKYNLILHAEENALIYAKGNLDGCILYTSPFMPCSKCAGLVIQSGIRRVVSYESSNPRWVDNFKLSYDILTEAGIEIVLY